MLFFVWYFCFELSKVPSLISTQARSKDNSVEHHDFSRIPWTRTNQLAEIAPEFYLPPPPPAAAPAGTTSDTTTTTSTEVGEMDHHIYSIDSIYALLRDWVFTKGEKMNFACIRAEAPPSLSSSTSSGFQSAETKKSS
jgi:hypothetical protein